MQNTLPPNTTQDAGSIPVALAMPEWGDPYVRRVVALYPANHLLKRLLLQHTTLEDIRIASKTTTGEAPHPSHIPSTTPLEIVQIQISEPQGCYLIHSNGKGIHRTIALMGTPLYASEVATLDL